MRCMKSIPDCWCALTADLVARSSPSSFQRSHFVWTSYSVLRSSNDAPNDACSSSSGPLVAVHRQTGGVHGAHCAQSAVCIMHLRRA